LISTNLQEGAVVIQADAFSFLEGHPNQQFNYVYIAPPQYKEMWKLAVISLNKHIEWLSTDAWVIVQIHPIEYKPIGDMLTIDNLVEFDQRRYGSTILVFYRRSDI
jgi:16S rRNA G966 N2-methylase RsmD